MVSALTNRRRTTVRHGSETELASASATLLRWAAAGDSAVLADLVSTLGRCGVPGLAEHLAPLAGHQQSEVRVAVAQALGTTTDDSPATIEALRTLSTDTHDEVRSWATFALAQSELAKMPGVEDALAARLDDPCDEVRVEAVRGLAASGHPRAIDTALELAPDWCDEPTFRDAVSRLQTPESAT